MAIECAKSLRADGWRVHTVLRWAGALQGEMATASDEFSFEPFRRVRATARAVPITKVLATEIEIRAAGLVIRRTRPSLVWVNTVLSAAYVPAALRLGIPVVLYVHELEPYSTGGLHRYRVVSVPEGLTVVACSPAVRSQLATHFACHEDDIGYLPSTVNASAVRAQAGGAVPQPSRVVACGTPDARKGADLWIDVAERLAAHRSGLDIRWIGGLVDPDLEERAKSSVRYVGQTPNPLIEIAAAAVFGLPSRSDAFPLVVLEAMALSRPVVAFDVGGVAAQLGDAGVLVPPNDTMGMAEEIGRLLDDPDRAAALGRAGRRRVEELYDVAAFARSIAGIAKGACER